MRIDYVSGPTPCAKGLELNCMSEFILIILMWHTGKGLCFITAVAKSHISSRMRTSPPQIAQSARSIQKAA
jgi:hypothetical protein